MPQFGKQKEMNLMAASSSAQEVFYCEKCKKTMVASKFYTYRDGTKLEMCKSCLTMHLNVYVIISSYLN